MKNIAIFSFVLVILFFSCKSNNKTGEETNVQITETTEAKPFVLPDIPLTFTEPEQVAEFLAMHYWDNFDFTNTAYINSRDVTEKAWAEYLTILNHVPLDIARKGVSNVMNKAANNIDTFNYFANLADKYLYDPNSPYRNEEYYIPVLEAMVNSTLLDETQKIRPTNRLLMANKNRLGQKASNFTYTLNSGKQGTLYGISSEYTLLFFHNPGCHACGEISVEIQASPLLQKMLSDKKLTILTIYPDEDIAEWKNHLSEFPTQWINGYDKQQEIQNKSVYDLKAIPTLYLLDRDKNVILKDTTIPEINQYFNSK